MTALGTITWWGSAAVELNLNGRCLLVDPYLNPTEPRANYICITRENHEHCHEPTLERLVAGPGFERLLAPRTCTMMSKLDSRVPADARDLEGVDQDKLTVMYPKYTRKPGRTYPGPTEVTLDGFHIEGFESSENESVNILGTEFWGKRYRPADGQLWPAGTGAYVGAGELPALGYVITHSETGLTFCHPGDLQEAFDSQRELRGQVDYLFLPTVTLEGVELLVIDNIRPRYVIPIHYRSAAPDFPIPLEIDENRLTTTDLAKGDPKPWADPDVYRREIHAMMKAHWYPTPDPPLARIERIMRDVEELGSQMLILEAGKPYDIPSA